MSNATAPAVRVFSYAQVVAEVGTDHDAFIELMNANITPFMREMIDADKLAEAEAGDYFMRSYVASEAFTLSQLEAKSNDELAADYVEAQARDDARYDEEGWDYEADEYYHYHQGLIQSLLDYRAAMARYTNQGPMTHRPFAALVAA